MSTGLWLWLFPHCMTTDKAGKSFDFIWGGGRMSLSDRSVKGAQVSTSLSAAHHCYMQILGTLTSISRQERHYSGWTGLRVNSSAVTFNRQNTNKRKVPHLKHKIWSDPLRDIPWEILKLFLILRFNVATSISPESKEPWGWCKRQVLRLGRQSQSRQRYS